MADEKSNDEVMIDLLHRLDKRLHGLQTLMNFQAMGPENILRFVHQDHEI